MRIAKLSDIIIFVNAQGQIELSDFDDLETIPESAMQFDELLHKAVITRMISKDEVKDLVDQTQPFMVLVS